MNRSIAVMLTGHMRTWNMCKNLLCDKIDQVFGLDHNNNHVNIDWYVNFWNSKTATSPEISDFFKNSNRRLVHLELTEYDSNTLLDPHKRAFSIPITSAIYNWKLKQKLALNKRINEITTGVYYDVVLWFRPDIVICTDTSHGDNAILNIREELYNNEHIDFQIGGDYVLTNNEYHGPSPHDVIPIMGSVASDIFSYQILDLQHTFLRQEKIFGLKPGDIHSAFGINVQKHLLTSAHPTIMPEIWPIVVRPTTDMHKVEEIIKTWHKDNTFAPNSIDEIWHIDVDKVYLKQSCAEKNIDLKDYTL